MYLRTKYSHAHALSAEHALKCTSKERTKSLERGLRLKLEKNWALCNNIKNSYFQHGLFRENQICSKKDHSNETRLSLDGSVNQSDLWNRSWLRKNPKDWEMY